MLWSITATSVCLIGDRHPVIVRALQQISVSFQQQPRSVQLKSAQISWLPRPGMNSRSDGAVAAAPASSMDDSANSRTGLLNQLLANNSQYAKSFDKPMTLGVKQKLSVITCMDSRLMVAKMLGLDLGDIEMIRNAGGRVTPDVIRSLFVAQEVPELSTREVLIIHHTDCGAQAAMRHHDHLVARMKELLAHWNIAGWALQAAASLAGSFLPAFLRKQLLNIVMRPFADPGSSLKEDIWLLRHSPLMPPHIPIHGLVYDVATGRLHHINSDLGSRQQQAAGSY